MKLFSVALAVIAIYSQAWGCTCSGHLQHSGIKTGVLGRYSMQWQTIWQLTDSKEDHWPLHPIGLWESLGFTAFSPFSCCEGACIYLHILCIIPLMAYYFLTCLQSSVLNASFLLASRLSMFSIHLYINNFALPPQ